MTITIIIIDIIIIIIDIATVVTNIIRRPYLGFIAQLEHRPAGRQSKVFGIIRIIRSIIITKIFIIIMIILIIRLIEYPNIMLHAVQRFWNHSVTLINPCVLRNA